MQRSSFAPVCQWATLLMLLGWIFQASAQQELSSTSGDLVKFMIPERNREGILIWQLTGERGKIHPNKILEIQTLQVNTFRGTNVDWTLTTPECIFNHETYEAASDAPVQIWRKDLEITGTGFHWLANETRFIIRNRVRVTISGGFTKKDLYSQPDACDDSRQNAEHFLMKPVSWCLSLLFSIGLQQASATEISLPVPTTPNPKSTSNPSAMDVAKAFTTIDSDSLDFDYGKRIAIFEGNVVAIDPKLILKCKTMKVYFAEKGNEVLRIEAFTDVRMLHEGKEGIGDKATFTKEKGVIILSGAKPKLRDEKGNWILSRGDGIIYNIHTKHMHVDKPTLEFQTTSESDLLKPTKSP